MRRGTLILKVGCPLPAGDGVFLPYGLFLFRKPHVSLPYALSESYHADSTLGSKPEGGGALAKSGPGKFPASDTTWL